MALRTLLIAGGGVLATAVIGTGVAIGGYSLARTQSALEHAADQLDNDNVRLALKASYVDNGDPTSFTGMALYNVEGTHLRMDIDTTYDKDEAPVRQTILMIGQDAYVGGGEMEYALPSGKRWLHVIEPKNSVESTRMTEVASWLRGAGNISKHEEGTIRGKHVTRYSGTLLDGTIQAWLDDDRVPLRLAVKTKDKSFSMDWRADVLEYGPQVVVQAPPHKETIEEEEWDRLTAE